MERGQARLSFLLLLLLLGALGSLHLLLDLSLLVLERSEQFGEEVRALGAIFLLRGLSLSGLEMGISFRPRQK